MATIRLVPSTYALSNTSYFSVSNASNAYANTDSTNYATFQTTNSSTSSRYIYLRGFNFSSIPSGAVVSAFTIKIKGYESGANTSTSYAPRLVNGTSALSNTTASQNFSTSSRTITIPTGALTWDAITTTYGSSFGIQIDARRNNRNTASYIYIYGAEIEVTYTVPNTYNVTATSTAAGVTATPATQSVQEGDSATITFSCSDISNYTVTDNGNDVTSNCVRHAAVTNGTLDTVLGNYTLVSGSFNSGSSYFEGLEGNGVNSSTTSSNYYSSSSGTIVIFTYDLVFNNIPNNATITRLYCEVNGHAESTSNSNEYMCACLYLGTSTAISDELNFKDIGTSNSTQTIEATTIPTVAQLSDLKLRCRLGYYGGAINGATCYIEYTVPGSGYYYIYTISNIITGHAVVIEEAGSGYVPPVEDPTKTYYPITISSINATTDPSNGTTRVEAGDDLTVTVTPSDPQVTLVLDNGIDITNQLVGPQNTYTVTSQISGASYGFELNSTTGYYTSTNAGVASSAAVCRVNFSLDTDCLVTIQYINYAQASNDYGIFGRVDAALGTTNTADSNPYLSCGTSAYNISTPQTLTYNLTAGNHYIDIKYRKNSSTNSNNDNLQWKITAIEASGTTDYTYTLTDINEKHSLIFVFGDVNFYYLTSSTSAGAKLFPEGQMVKLQGDSYTLVIIPDNNSSTITLRDNNTNVTSSLEVVQVTDDNNNTITEYIYQLNNINANHNLIVSIDGATIQLYIKQNGSWVAYSTAYKKINGSWVEMGDLTSVFNATTNYRKGN